MNTVVYNVAEEQRRPFVIQTFTTAFDMVEDRIKLMAVDGHGEHQVIWLTRRLLDRLIPHFIKHLENHAALDVSVELEQSIQQDLGRKARLRDEKLAPVVVGPSCSQWLCKTVNITPDGKVLSTVFRDDVSKSAVIRLSIGQIRTVLDILYDTYRKADWQTAVFPNWICETPKLLEAHAKWIN